MEANKQLYKNQGIHLISAIFTVDNGVTKVLLIKRKNEPFKDHWALVGGALYNNETLIEGMEREIKEKTGITDVDLYFSNIFDDPKRSMLMRMVAFVYIGIIDKNKVKLLTQTLKTSDSSWFLIDDIPKLAYDHNQIIMQVFKTLKEKILTTDLLKGLFPNGFTIPELQKVCEVILEKKLDRRNFRKKVLALDLVISTEKVVNFNGNKPAKVYRFKGKKEKR